MSQSPYFATITVHNIVPNNDLQVLSVWFEPHKFLVIQALLAFTSSNIVIGGEREQFLFVLRLSSNMQSSLETENLASEIFYFKYLSFPDRTNCLKNYK